jgi:hypothetical protein
MKGDEEKARASGCDDYVTKPYSPVDLRRLIRRYLEVTKVPGPPRGAAVGVLGPRTARGEARGGRLGFNAKFMIEMSEETGSKGLREIAERYKSDFSADVLIASDGQRVRQDCPTMALGCRGAVNFDLIVELREGGHHFRQLGWADRKSRLPARPCVGEHRRAAGAAAGRGIEGSAPVGGSARRDCRYRDRWRGTLWMS